MVSIFGLYLWIRVCIVLISCGIHVWGFDYEAVVRDDGIAELPLQGHPDSKCSPRGVLVH